MSAIANDSHTKVLAALSSSEVLCALSPDACANLAERGAHVDLEMGAYLARVGDPGDAVYVILDGEIEVRASTTGGRDVVLMEMKHGEIVGEMDALDGGARTTDLVAARRAHLWRIPRHALIETLEAEPKAAVAMLAELSGRLRRTNVALESRATLDLGGRLAQLLVSERSARDLIALTQSELARRLGASRETVNRKLHEWTLKGWVEVTQAGVRLLQPGHIEDLGRLPLEG